MRQQVEVTMTLTLWLAAAMTEDDVVTHVRTRLPDAFGEALTAMTNPVDILMIRQEAVYAPRELPTDPDERNDDRAAWAEVALAAFAAETGCDRAEALPDLLCDLMHQCDRTGVSFAAELGRARWHYATETADQPTRGKEPA
jgi:hypothetical protein